MHLTHIEKNVNVIRNAAHHNPWRIHFPNDRRQVAMHPRPNRFIQNRLTVLRAENQMRAELRERLRHGYLKQGDRVEVNMAFGQTMRSRNYSWDDAPGYVERRPSAKVAI